MTTPVIHLDARAVAAATADLKPGGDGSSRTALGLPDSKPIVMTGHQPVAWHPGIVAKAMAAESIAARTGSFGALLIIDTVDLPPMRMEVPTGVSPGDLDVRTVDLLDDAPGVLCTRPPGEMRDVRVDDAATQGVRAGLERLQRACAQVEADTAGAQAAAILKSWLEPSLETVFASALLATSYGRSLVATMRADPQAAIATFNEAVQRHPRARVRPLGDGELPLWVLEGASARHARIADLERPNEHFLPRALVTTALARCAVCDLFVHGLGGSVYDVVMVDWVRNWLGWSPCPSIEISADLQLDLGSPVHRDAMLQERRHALRAATHDPGGEGPGLSQIKAADLEAIDARPTGSAERACAFTSMHDHLAAARDPVQLASLEAAVARAGRSGDIARRRDWPAVCYSAEAMDALSDGIAQIINEA